MSRFIWGPGEIEVLTPMQKFDDYHDERGRFATAPSFAVTKLGQNPALESAAGDYSKAHGIDRPALNYDHITANPGRAKKIAAAYDSAQQDTPEAKAAYAQLSKEVDQQYDYLTKKMGIKVDVSAEDPYPNVTAMQHDLTANKHITVLSTKATGHHPYFTDQQNEHFRAVHDAFGHAATGRGFDRHGEEAAWLSHSLMFSPLARKAMTTETRGQNSVLTTEGHGFPEQKIAVLPDEFCNIPKNELKTAKKQAKKLKKALGIGDLSRPLPEFSGTRSCFGGGRAQHDHNKGAGASADPSQLTDANKLTPLTKMLPIDLGFLKYNQNHGEHGRFASGPGGPKHDDHPSGRAGVHNPQEPTEENPLSNDQIQSSARSHTAGFTIGPLSGAHAKTGYVVSLGNQYGDNLPMINTAKAKKAFKVRMDAFLVKVQAAARQDSKIHYGGWRDSANHQFVLDEVEIHPYTEEGRKTAIRLGKERNQQSIYCIDTKTEIKTGGTGR